MVIKRLKIKIYEDVVERHNYLCCEGEGYLKKKESYSFIIQICKHLNTWIYIDIYNTENTTPFKKGNKRVHFKESS